MRAFLLVQFDLACNHVPEVPVEVAGPFLVTVTSMDLSERFLEKCGSRPFIPVVVVLPQEDRRQPAIIQCFHKAWRKKIPQRSEDGFLSANPAPERGRLAQSARETAIFAARNGKADLGFSALKSAFRSLSDFMLFMYVSAIRGTAAMSRQTICQVFHDRADHPRYLSFRRDSAV